MPSLKKTKKKMNKKEDVSGIPRSVGSGRRVTAININPTTNKENNAGDFKALGGGGAVPAACLTPSLIPSLPHSLPASPPSLTYSSLSHFIYLPHLIPASLIHFPACLTSYTCLTSSLLH
ncbi:hypothetical protein Pmani_007800 [Petrolisthes manimaculis]|uniref:Uncharacterized protein n=1 Tax=Petrolisthes manimaculis TaxID=1843537 RepID=A0AAE1Q7K0_9EUCA|nr:hypothetical protein Pmani_007800 [Petrolisthes manimaculis]